MEQPMVIEYGITRPKKPSNLIEFRDQLRDIHTNSVSMGPAGPIALFSAFLSSSAVLMYRGIRKGVVWIERKVRGNQGSV